MKTLKELRSRLDYQRGQQAHIESEIGKLKSRRTDQLRSRRRHEQAREVIRQVALETQQQLQYHIGDITSLALEAVFPFPYELQVEFIQRRNKTECDLWFSRDGNRIDPLTASGGGAVDVATFALRIASWSMNRPRSRPVVILDEPMRFLSEEYQDKASAMIKEVSNKLGLQFIIITHEPILAAEADKVFTSKIHNKVTQIK